MSVEELLATAADVMNEQDQARPFNRLGTDADYEHFGRCAFLTVAEAVALSLGKDPRFVDWHMIRPYLGSSIFAFEYAKRLDLIERAVIWEELPERFTPLEFLTWAHRYKLRVPEAFIRCTFDRGEPIQYWHDLCAAFADELTAMQTELRVTREELEEQLALSEEDAQRTFDEWLVAQNEIIQLTTDHEEHVATLKDEIARLETRHTALTDQTPAKPVEAIQDDLISPGALKSLLTITITAAIGGYGYDPRSNKSRIPQEIADDAQRIGLRMTNETVLKYLKEASTLQGLVLPETAHRKPKSAKPKPKSA